MAKKRVVIGMSGGVDSAVSAYLLKQQGYEVIGLFMNNWKETGNNDVCTSESDYADVRRVCALVDIPYYSVDLSNDYWDKVFEQFLSEYRAGRTPNPDVLCNKEIKFGAFWEQARKMGADYIATGHYCGIVKKDGHTYLRRAVDENKCQTYFLNQVSEEQIENVIFPLADMLKPDVRILAEEIGLVNANKKDSTGVCFIGERNFRKFLTQYIPMKEGDIKDLNGNVLGKHKGVFFYTLGQHKGFGLGGVKGRTNNDSWFIIKKDVENNILYVNCGETEDLYSKYLTCKDFNFITEKIANGTRVLVRIRHRQPLQDATFIVNEDNSYTIKFDNKQRAIVAGQYCVAYIDKICIGGGVIETATYCIK
ncbi:MAG: tRNA 2-thiouridine(34) synthase MnmA [Clostridia bacterium]